MSSLVIFLPEKLFLDQRIGEILEEFVFVVEFRFLLENSPLINHKIEKKKKKKKKVQVRTILVS
jgi:hypothetical protein